jgi:hypothetical protein
MERAGVNPGLFLESGGDLLRPAWNPVRLNRQGTLELRGLDSNLPETTLAAFELVPAAVARTREDGLTVTPDGDTPAFEVSGDRLLVPAFGHPSGEIFHAAVAGGDRRPCDDRLPGLHPAVRRKPRWTPRKAEGPPHAGKASTQ